MRLQTTEPAGDTRALGMAAFAPRRERDLYAPLGRIGTLEARLAVNAAEISAAQAIRYRVFYEELGAGGGARESVERRDADRFDPICDHLLVFDTSLPGGAAERIVGTYRLLRQERADVTGGFYSGDEFRVRELLSRHPDKIFVELGRSCVLPLYRSKRTIELLWHGIWAYVRHHGIDAMIGCASFHGTVPAAHAQALGLLGRQFRARPAWDVRATPSRHQPLDWMPREAVDPRLALAAMPPLLKAYLRAGARIGDGCVIDEAFRTTDVFVVMPVSEIEPRYIQHYSGNA